MRVFICIFTYLTIVNAGGQRYIPSGGSTDKHQSGILSGKPSSGLGHLSSVEASGDGRGQNGIMKILATPGADLLGIESKFGSSIAPLEGSSHGNNLNSVSQAQSRGSSSKFEGYAYGGNADAGYTHQEPQSKGYSYGNKEDSFIPQGLSHGSSSAVRINDHSRGPTVISPHSNVDHSSASAHEQSYSSGLRSNQFVDDVSHEGSLTSGSKVSSGYGHGKQYGRGASISKPVKYSQDYSGNIESQSSSKRRIGYSGRSAVNHAPGYRSHSFTGHTRNSGIQKVGSFRRGISSGVSGSGYGYGRNALSANAVSWEDGSW